MPPPTLSGSNRVMELLAEARIDAGSVADALHGVTMATGVLMSADFGNGTVTVEQAQERAGDALFDVAVMMERLGERVEDLQLEIVRADPRRKRLAVCVHEAGHALGVWLVTGEVALVSVDPDDFPPDHDGITLAGGQIDFILRWGHHRPDEATRKAAEDSARAATVIALLGAHSEAASFPNRFPTTFGTDLGVARAVAACWAPPNEEAHWMESAHRVAQQVAQRARRALRALARALDDHDRLDAEQVDRILRPRMTPWHAVELGLLISGRC